MTVTRRARMRPVLYPAAFSVTLVLNLVVGSGVSPYAATRPLAVALAIGLGVPWAAGLAVGDRNVAGLAGAVIVLLLLAPPSPAIAILAVIALGLIAFTWRAAQRSAGPSPAGERLWPVLTRALTAGAVILLIAVGVKAVQLDRVESVIHDLVAESPLRQRLATAASDTDLPNIYLVLLDGYPRADKLASVFGIDGSEFITGLDDRGFVVASHSRSNHSSTRLTLAQMFNYMPDMGASGSDGDHDDLWRHRINEGQFFDDIRGLGYEVVAVSPGYEGVALRRADRFIDTGQPNELEWALLHVTAVGGLVEAFMPNLAADVHRGRMIDALRVTEEVAREDSTSRRFVFTHIAGPHSPLVFERDGSPIPDQRRKVTLADSVELAELGWSEYVRRLDAQTAYLGDRTLELVDGIVAGDPSAVVVVFSDHGSGALNDPGDPHDVDADLRTANLLAVRSPGRTGIINDRSTLANVLPRLLRAYAGAGPPDVSESIFVSAENPESARVFVRPD